MVVHNDLIIMKNHKKALKKQLDIESNMIDDVSQIVLKYKKLIAD